MRSKWVADFETTTDPNDCRVWAYGIARVESTNESQVLIGNSIEEFIKFLTGESRVVYFHNLAFDGSFILDWLLKNGYRYVKESPQTNEFTTLISQSAKFYSITVVWWNGNTTEFRDSLKKIPMGVANAAIAFNTPFLKGSIDYHSFRDVNHIPTNEERAYIANDVLIICKALSQQFEVGMVKLTAGSDALNDFITMFGRNRFKHMFPIFSLNEDSELRRALKGGYTYLNPKFKGRELGAGCVYDVNSLYPSVMYDEILPYGNPTYIDSNTSVKPTQSLFITAIEVVAKLRKGYIPCIQIKGSMYYTETEYVDEITEPVLLYVTNIDLALYREHYHLKVLSVRGTWYFDGVKGMFKSFVDKWSTIKESTTDGKRAIAKLQLVSLYGKFATNPNITGKYPILVDNVVRLVKGEEMFRQPIYTPMGVFITSYARSRTIRAAQSHYDRFIYADTDSLHLLGNDPPNLLIDSVKTGYWKHESDFTKAWFARPKAYTEIIDGKYSTHIAGMPKDIAETVRFEHYANGHVFTGKKQPVRVSGGIILKDIEYTLK